ncbi:hypothetical protein HDU98_006717 [Podochytrium sp. JEL0797]|nr:hypothetical protein HDU98_006717 [Podochytrium sp. JEL0797]
MASPSPSRIILCLGGARSGKSTFAEKLAVSTNLPLLYIATAKRSDAEMTYRIYLHRANQPWTTIECPIDLSLAPLDSAGVILVDCATVWLANVMGRIGWPKDEEVNAEAVAWAQKVDDTARAEMTAFLDRCEREGKVVVIVANEVGLGVCPEGKISRYYRDTLGRINQDIGRRAERVYMMIAGCGVDIKRLSDEATLKRFEFAE